MKTVEFKNVVWQEEKYFVAQCLNVDVSSFGNSKEEALLNLNEALALYFDDHSPNEDFQTINSPEIITQKLNYA